VLYQPVEPFEPLFRVRHLPLQRYNAAVDAFRPFSTTNSEAVQHYSEPFRFEEPIKQMPCDQAVELVHPDRAAFTRALAFADACRARVVAVNDAVLGGARAQGHPTPAGGAHRQTGQEDRPGGNPRRHHLRTPGMKLALNLLEHLRLDQAWHRYRDHLLFRFALARARGGLVEL